MESSLFLQKFNKYKSPLPHGLRLPKIEIEEKYYKMLNEHSSISNFDFLRKLCWKGVKDLGIDKRNNSQEYFDRLSMELDTFKDLGFVDYVLLNWDILNFCHENKIPVNRGRGSAAGSLCLYCLNVTGIDPIENNLFFERFVSKARARRFEVDGVWYLDGALLPDVDSDIGYYERKKVIEYIDNKYNSKTAKILTLNTLSSKLCLKECGKIVAELSESETNTISSYVPKVFGKVESITESINDSEELKDWANSYQKAIKIAKRIEGLIKNTGVHPSGIAISLENIDSIMPLQLTNDGEIVTGFDMKWVAEYAVKFDILGLRTLSVIRECCKILGINEKDIDCNDPIIYKELQDLKYRMGLFQIEADCNYRVCTQVKPNSLDELSDVIALGRPAALAFVDSYVQVKNGEAEIQKRHPEMDKILESQKGMFLYQEGLMQAANKVFGFSLEEAEIIRKCVGKKLTKEMKKWKPRVYEQAKKLGLDKSLADFYWQSLNDSADYGFNKCLSPNTLIELEGERLSTLNNVKKGDKIRAFDTKKKQDCFVEVINKYSSEQELYEVELEDGRKIECSISHKFMTDEGMKPLSEIFDRDLSILCSDKHFKKFPENNMYAISNFGDVFSFHPKTKGGRIKPQLDHHGYFKTQLGGVSNRKKIFNHQLVGRTFLRSKMFKDAIINHKNGNPLDNRIENLEWVTLKQNVIHAHKTDLIKGCIKNMPIFGGSSHGRAKLNKEEVEEIKRLLKNGVRGIDIANIFGVNPLIVSRIKNNKTYKFNGMKSRA